MNTPDQIYDEFEARRTEAEAERTKKKRGRIADVILLGIPSVTLLLWAISEKDPMTGGIGIPFFIYASIQLQKRWQLEDKIERLEKQK